MTRRTRSSSAASQPAAAESTQKDEEGVARRTRSTTLQATPQQPPGAKSTHYASTSYTPRTKKRRTLKGSSKAKHFSSYVLDGEEYRVGDNVYVAMDNFVAEQEDLSTEICQICNKLPKSAFTLECSSCLRGYHGRCLKPPLKTVPPGDWLCPNCNAGNCPAPPDPPRTALQMVLYGNKMLSLARIEGFTQNRTGTDEVEMLVQYYCPSNKTHLGKQHPFRAREMYLVKGNFWEPVESILRKATVCTQSELSETSGDDVFMCDFVYDEEWQRFRRIGKEEANDDLDWGGSDGEEDQTYQPEKDKGGRKHKQFRKDGQDAAIARIREQTNDVPPGYVEEEDAPAPACPYAAMRLSLHPGKVPTGLTCRDEEKAVIKHFVSEAMDGRGSTNVLYICGVPGTGKTISVIEVIFNMREKLQAKGVQFMALNGLQIPSPQHVYSRMWEKMAGQKVSPARALTLLEQRFSSGLPNPGAHQNFTLVVVDEVDVLMTRDQAVLYNLFEWPMRPAANLCVIAISNTHDLDERVLPRIASRLAASKLVFKPYNVEQLCSIVKQRLEGHSLFQPNAIEFAARKVSSDSGDARRVLELMRRAVEVAEADNKTNTSQQTNKPVGVRHVNEAIREMYNSIHMQYLRSCALMEKLLLVGIAQETRAISKPECALHGAVKRMSLYCQMIGKDEPVPCFMLPVAQRLSAKRLILAGPTSQHLKMKVALNVQTEDIAAVVKADTTLQQLAGFL